jgi:hypothetical protein
MNKEIQKMRKELKLDHEMYTYHLEIMKFIQENLSAFRVKF